MPLTTCSHTVYSKLSSWQFSVLSENVAEDGEEI